MIERAEELERSLSEQVPWALSPSFVHGMFLVRLGPDRRGAAAVRGHVRARRRYGRLVPIDLPRLARRGRAPGRELGESTRPRAGNEGARPGRTTSRRPGEPPPARSSRHTWGTRTTPFAPASMLRASRAPMDSISVSSAASSPSGSAALSRRRKRCGRPFVALVETEEGVSLWPRFATRTLSTAIEALVAAGDLERAQSVVDRLEEHARSMAVPSAIAAAACCRALVLAQDGNVDAARASIEHADRAYGSR